MNYKATSIFAVVAAVAISHQSRADDLSRLAGQQMAADCAYNLPLHQKIVSDPMVARDYDADYVQRLKDGFENEKKFCAEVKKAIGD